VTLPQGPAPGRSAGLLVPLFSCHSAAGWGIGEFGDVVPLAAWMRDAGLQLLQLLPLNEMAPGQRSPYSAISAMALDPVFISVPSVPEFAAMGGETALDAAQRGTLAHVRAQPGVDYWVVRTLKERALRGAFRTFLEAEWVPGTPRAGELRAFIGDQSWWLDDYAIFRAAFHVSDGQDWRAWPADVRNRDASALARVRREHSREILYRQYLQWIAHTQWQRARRDAAGVRMFGDFPFMVSGDSADAWIHQHLFSFDGTVGAPPDAFSRDGQNWKLPVYRWDVLRARGYDWFFERARRTADLFDGFRVDHVVGLFRTWVFPHDGRKPYFTPAAEPAQAEQGAAVMAAIQSAGAQDDPRLREGLSDGAGHSRFPGAAMGAPLARARTAVHRPGRVSAALRGHVRHARHGDVGRVVERSRTGRAGRRALDRPRSRDCRCTGHRSNESVRSRRP
jgi:4-alpha-glucanotransferase